MNYCSLCRKQLNTIDYRKTSLLNANTTPWSKIKTRKDTNMCSKHQRRLADAIKRARYMALIPYTSR